MSKQIAVSGKSIDEYKRLVSFLKEEGYKLQGILADLKDDDTVVAVIVDSDNMVAYNTSVTIMACRAASGLKAISVEAFMKKQQQLVSK